MWLPCRYLLRLYPLEKAGRLDGMTPLHLAVDAGRRKMVGGMNTDRFSAWTAQPCSTSLISYVSSLSFSWLDICLVDYEPSLQVRFLLEDLALDHSPVRESDGLTPLELARSKLPTADMAGIIALLEVPLH
jgi:hypothetical protein